MYRKAVTLFQSNQLNRYKMTFTANTDRLAQVTEQARARVKSAAPGWEAIVTVSKSSPKARLCFYGFHFAKTGETFVGEVKRLADGSVQRTEVVLMPPQDLAKKKAGEDVTTKAVYLLTQDETVAERDRLELLKAPTHKDRTRLRNLCRHSLEAFGTLLSKLEVTLTDEEGDELLKQMEEERGLSTDWIIEDELGGGQPETVEQYEERKRLAAPVVAEVMRSLKPATEAIKQSLSSPAMALPEVIKEIDGAWQTDLDELSRLRTEIAQLQGDYQRRSATCADMLENHFVEAAGVKFGRISGKRSAYNSIDAELSRVLHGGPLQFIARKDRGREIVEPQEENPAELEFSDENGNVYVAIRIVGDLYGVTLNATYVLRNSATLCEVKQLQTLLCG